MSGIIPPIPLPFGASSGNPGSLNANRVNTMPTTTEPINTTTTKNMSQSVVDENLPQLLDSRGGSYVTNVPAFDKEDFTNGPFVPMSSLSTSENPLTKHQNQWSNAESRLANQDKRLKNISVSCLPNDVMKSAIKYKTAKEMWNDLILAHEGASDTRDTKIATLRLKFNSFKSLEDDERSTKIKEFMAIVEDEPSVGKADARSGQWDDITMKKEPLPKLIGAAPSGTLENLISLSDLTLNMADLTLETPILKKTRPSVKMSHAHVINKRTKKSPTIPKPCFDKKTDSSTEQLFLTLMEEVKSLKRFRNHLSDDCYSKLKCSTCGSTDHLTKEHLEHAAVKKRISKLKAQIPLKPSPKKAPLIPKPFLECKYCGFNNHHFDYCEFYPGCKDYLKRSVWYLDSSCSRHMTWIKQYLHKYLKQSGLKVVFNDDSSGDTEGYGLVNYNRITFTRVAYMNEFRNYNLEEFCDEKGISQNFSSPSRTMLNSAKLHKQFWREAVNTACYTQNRSVIVKSHGKTSYDVFGGRSPDISYFYVFGYLVHIHNHRDHLGKFDKKADDGFFLGYSPVAKAFRVFNIRRQEIKENIHVTFGKDDEAISQSSIEGDAINFNENRSFPDDEFLEPKSEVTQCLGNTEYFPFIPAYENITPSESPILQVYVIPKDPHEFIRDDNHPALNELILRTPVPQDRWSREKHIKLVNIIGKPLAGITTRSRIRDSDAASASKCLYVNFLSEMEPKKLIEAIEEEEEKGVNLENESLKDEIIDLKKFIEKWTRSKVTLYQLLSEQVPRNIVKGLGGKGRRKENISFNKEPLPKLIGAAPSGTLENLISLSDLTLNMADLTLETPILKKTRPSVKMSHAHVINKRTKKSPTIPKPCFDKKTDSSTEQLFLTLMEEVKSLKRFRNHLSDDCYSKLKCSTCGSTDHLTKEHLEHAAVKKRISKLKAQIPLKPSPKKAPLIPKPFLECKYCGFNNHHFDYCEFYPGCKDYLKRSVWYLDSSCSRHMTWIKQYLHKYLKQSGLKVVFNDDSSGDTEGNHNLEEFCDEKGISQNFSSPCIPEQNGVVERRNRTIIKAARTMLNSAKLHKQFWREAVNTACYTQNRSVIVKSHGKTSYDVFGGRSPDISYFYVFGYLVHIHNHRDHLGKFDKKADDGFFLGYSPVAKAFRVFNIRRQEIKENIHVTFGKDDEAISQSSIEGDAINFNENRSFPDDEFLEPKSEVTQCLGNTEYFPFIPAYENITPSESPILQVYVIPKDPHEFIRDDNHPALNELILRTPVPQDRWSREKHIKLVNIIGKPLAGITTRSRIRDSDAASASKCLYVNFLSEMEPKKLIEAIEEEEEKGKTIIGTKSIWKNKMDDNRIVIKNKARLVAQGYNHQEEIDYEETFAHVARLEMPYASPNNLGLDESRVSVNKTLFRDMTGSLMYLIASRPDIQFSTCFNLKAYSDSDYVGCNMDKKSTSGGCQILEGKLVCWSAKKQSSVVMSSIEAEYVAAAGCCAQVLWIKSQLADYDVLMYFFTTITTTYSIIKDVEEETMTITFLLSWWNKPLSFTQDEFISALAYPFMNVVPLPPKETVRAGLATLGLFDKDKPTLSSSVLVNSSPLKRNNDLTLVKPHTITAASFQKSLASEVPLTSHMLKVAKLSEEPEQSLIPPSREVNADDTADKSLSRAFMQSVTQSKAPTDLKTKKKRIPPSSKPKSPSKVRVILPMKQVAETQHAEVTVDIADATKSLAVLDQNVEEERKDARFVAMEEDKEAEEGDTSDSLSSRRSIPDDDLASITGFKTQDSTDHVSKEGTETLHAFADKPAQSDPLGHLHKELGLLHNTVNQLESSITKHVSDSIQANMHEIITNSLKEKLFSLLSYALKDTLPRLIKASIKSSILESIAEELPQFNAFNKLESQRFVLLQKELSTSLHNKMSKSVRLKGEQDSGTTTIAIVQREQPSAQVIPNLEQAPPVNEEKALVLHTSREKSLEEDNSEKSETDDEPPTNKLKFLIPSSSIPSPTPLKSIMPEPPKYTKVVKMTLAQFTEHLSQATSSIFYPTPPREPTPPRDESKENDIATEEPLEDTMPFMEEGGLVPKMPKTKSFTTSAQKWTKHEIKKAKMMKEYKHQISFRADQLPITKISYVANPNNKTTIKITRGDNPLNRVEPDSSLGVMPIEGLVINEPVSGIFFMNRNTDVDFQREEEFHLATIVQLIRIQKLIQREVMKGISECNASESNIRRIRVKDIVKKVDDYLKTYSSAGMDISWNKETHKAIKKLTRQETKKTNDD
uniref:Retrovirus-related Pol polyprotein from transposon TNT 1-94 n=1 Tax=Tanacetum cinerariifolium TaxID=118510 RepID=A0A6L2LVG7_TANCI|nr:retrovirus-related Pol polyprotein from transposon TNT 1-94 [Tanacetum cinerariifolium]